MGKVAGIKFGKVEIFSETESLENMRTTMTELINQLGYPEMVSTTQVQDDEEEKVLPLLDEEDIPTVEELEEEEVKVVEEEKERLKVAPWAKKRG